ncbi:hypothetical protein HKK70_08690 [Bacillus safensis]|uniref:hypothetical protein n=1 Tax=Bacillus safensis TaxID=561879 RepID=UPI00146D55CE|nr:hypothetical protein [Bacillus safensis]MCM3366028.1 hypothetical protein [Bacillus safensis]NMW01841.1 hypothetical protein [Bacillus safensis]
MDPKHFKKLTSNLSAFTAQEIDDFNYMTSDELNSYQRELENDTGNLSDWDHLRAFYTLKSIINSMESEER